MNKKTISFIIFAFFLELGFLFAYGFGSRYQPTAVNTNDAIAAGQTFVNYFVILPLLFAIVGFGLLISSMINETKSGMAIALFVVAL